MSGIVFAGGPIATMDDRRRIVDGIVIEGSRISFAGPAAEARAIAPPDATVVELSGRTAVPGFVDAHDHLSFTGAELAAVDVRSPGVTSIAGLVARIAEAAEGTPDGATIRAVGMNDRGYPDGRLPTRWDLDGATRVHPSSSPTSAATTRSGTRWPSRRAASPTTWSIRRAVTSGATSGAA